MNYQHKADDTRNQARKQKKYFRTCVPFAVTVMIFFMIGCATNPPLANKPDVSSNQADRPTQKAVEAQHTDIAGNKAVVPDEGNSRTPSSTGSEPVVGTAFPTFKSTGIEICTNGKGRPLIYLFSSSTCPHCQWGGGVYDFIVKYYAASGLIEAHHYDIISGDDLLTEEIETAIPADMLELYHRGSPNDLVPYYGFGCEYDRVGNGFEKENDLEAEGEEMRRVIEDLVQSVSK
jgi:hypothetical protein